jgi:hypothetical protein
MNNVLSLVIAVVILTLPAFSQGMTKAGKLRDDIVTTESGTKDADERRQLSDSLKWKIEHTSSYVVGMCDAWNSDHPGFVPQRVGWLEVMGVIRRYIDAHPERSQDLAADVAKQAVLEAYHRKKKTNP